jgi:hypothetical protein
MIKTIELKVKDKNYKVEYPNVGKFLDVEFLKAQLSNGLYGTLVMSNIKTSYWSLDLIDTEAYLTVFVPAVIKDLKTSFRELGLEDSLEIVKVYKEQLKPWIEEWQKIFTSEEDKTTSEK